MKLVSLNIEGDKHYDLLFPFIKKENPDVICLQEVLEEDFEYLKNEFGYEGVFKPWSYFYSHNPYHEDLHGRRFGNAIFAKSIIDTKYSFYFGEEGYCFKPFEEFSNNRLALRSYVVLVADVVDSLGNVFKVATTHFPVTHKGESSDHQLEILPEFFKQLDIHQDVIICGDFNAPRGKETFTRIAQKYQDNIPFHYKTSIDNSIHRDGDQNIMLMVDGLFTTPLYSAKNVVLQHGVSDHMAIVAHLEKNSTN